MYRETVHLDIFIIRALIKHLHDEILEHVPDKNIGFIVHTVPPAKGEKWNGQPVTEEGDILLLLHFSNDRGTHGVVITLSPLINILGTQWLPPCRHEEGHLMFIKAGIY